MNIAFVSHLGDVVDTFDNTGQWTNANYAMKILETPMPGYPLGIPYGIAMGNHDNNNGASSTNFNSTFGVSRFTGRSYYGGYYGTNNDNNYELFTAGDMDYIVIHLAYVADANPIPADVLDWADNLLNTNRTRRAILVYHQIVGLGNPGAFTPKGQAIYDRLKGNPNLFLMLGGHTDGEGRRTDTYNGSTVHTLLADYQGRTPNGGNGWLRILEFSPANNEIRVKTYSPSLNQWETDPDSQFTLPYNMGGTGDYSNLGTVPGIASGGSASISWPGLTNGTAYQWLTEVSDGSLTTRGSTWVLHYDYRPLIRPYPEPLWSG